MDAGLEGYPEQAALGLSRPSRCDFNGFERVELLIPVIGAKTTCCAQLRQSPVFGGGLLFSRPS